MLGRLPGTRLSLGEAERLNDGEARSLWQTVQLRTKKRSKDRGDGKGVCGVEDWHLGLSSTSGLVGGHLKIRTRD